MPYWLTGNRSQAIPRRVGTWRISCFVNASPVGVSRVAHLRTWHSISRATSWRPLLSSSTNSFISLCCVCRILSGWEQNEQSTVDHRAADCRSTVCRLLTDSPPTKRRLTVGILHMFKNVLVSLDCTQSLLFSSTVIERLEWARSTAARRMERKDEKYSHSPHGRQPFSLQSRARSRLSIAPVSQLLREKEGIVRNADDFTARVGGEDAAVSVLPLSGLGIGGQSPWGSWSPVLVARWLPVAGWFPAGPNPSHPSKNWVRLEERSFPFQVFLHPLWIFNKHSIESPRKKLQSRSNVTGLDQCPVFQSPISLIPD